MKKYLLFLVAAMLATVARAAVGDKFTYQGLKFEVTSEEDHTVSVSKNPNAYGAISIPSFAVNGSSRYFVTGISYGAFEAEYDYPSYATNLTSVTIPNSVTSIGSNAFKNCVKLTSVTIPNSVTYIGTEAFYNCEKLTSVTIPDAVTKIEASTFESCSSLTSVSIPNSVTEIGESAFYWCSSLTSVNIPNSVTTIGRSAFRSCESLTSVNIPNSVTTIGGGAFNSCSSLTSVNIPNSVTTIGRSAFGSCESLSEIVVENGNSNYTSEDGVLFNFDKTELLQCPGGKTEEYSIPNSVTTIGGSAFSGCSSLTSVNIPNSVTTIGGSAFSGCSSLTSVNIPNSVTTIGEYAFNSCSSLTSVNIPNSVTTIGDHAFYYCPSLTFVNIPNSVTTIGDHAFMQCGLTSVSIPASVTEIKGSTFYYCIELKTIYNQNPTPQKIGENAFYEVPTDAVVYIPKGSFNKYFVADGWTQFTDFREMGALDIALSEQTLDLTAGKTATVTATVTKDDDVTIESEEWTSSNPEVATVDNGVITAVAPGEAVIWFTAVDGYGLPHTEKCEVTVSAAPTLVESITLDLTSVEAVEGDEFRLTATVTPDNATDKTVAWSSSDETVATVSAEGLVKVLKEGSCVITVTTTDGSDLKAECSVTVKPLVILVESITLDLTSVEAVEGDEFQLTATVTPDNATDKTVAWSSSDETVATVSAEGLVKVLKEGSCVITVTTTDGSDLKAECSVSVLAGIDGILSNTSVPAEIFNLQGVKVSTAIERLPAGFYIVRQGNTVKKVAVK